MEDGLKKIEEEVDHKIKNTEKNNFAVTTNMF